MHINKSGRTMVTQINRVLGEIPGVMFIIYEDYYCNFKFDTKFARSKWYHWTSKQRFTSWTELACFTIEIDLHEGWPELVAYVGMYSSYMMFAVNDQNKVTRLRYKGLRADPELARFAIEMDSQDVNTMVTSYSRLLRIAILMNLHDLDAGSRSEPSSSISRSKCTGTNRTVKFKSRDFDRKVYGAGPSSPFREIKLCEFQTKSYVTWWVHATRIHNELTWNSIQSLRAEPSWPLRIVAPTRDY